MRETRRKRQTRRLSLFPTRTRVLRCPDSSTKSPSIDRCLFPALSSHSQSSIVLVCWNPPSPLSRPPSARHSPRRAAAPPRRRRPFGAHRRRCGHGAAHGRCHRAACLPATYPIPTALSVMRANARRDRNGWLRYATLQIRQGVNPGIHLKY